MLLVDFLANSDHQGPITIGPKNGKIIITAHRDHLDTVWWRYVVFEKEEESQRMYVYDISEMKLPLEWKSMSGDFWLAFESVVDDILKAANDNENIYKVLKFENPRTLFHASLSTAKLKKQDADSIEKALRQKSRLGRFL
jgi:hypothetical protein